MKYTPGPWRIEGRPGYSAPIVVVGKRRIAMVLYEGGSEDREVDANARLIAVAPRLLEALEALVGNPSDDWRDAIECADGHLRTPRQRALIQANAVIAEARRR